MNSTAVQNRLLTAVLECETIYLDKLADIVAEDLQIQVPISTGKGCWSSAWPERRQVAVELPATAVKAGAEERLQPA